MTSLKAFARTRLRWNSPRKAFRGSFEGTERFAERSELGPVGFEQSPKTVGNSSNSQSGGAESGAFRLQLFEHWFQDPLSDRLRDALKSSIKAHGAITGKRSNLNSAVKRLYGVLKALDKGAFDNARRSARAKLEGGNQCQ